jgi:hypothetical protein
MDVHHAIDLVSEEPNKGREAKSARKRTSTSRMVFSFFYMID